MSNNNNNNKGCLTLVNQQKTLKRLSEKNMLSGANSAFPFPKSLRPKKPKKNKTLHNNEVYEAISKLPNESSRLSQAPGKLDTSTATLRS